MTILYALADSKSSGQGYQTLMHAWPTIWCKCTASEWYNIRKNRHFVQLALRNGSSGRENRRQQ